MSLIYLTGAPGIGKTTLQKELAKRGYETYDLDDPALGGAHNKETGSLVVIPPVDQRPPEWFTEHEWRIYPEAITALRTKAHIKNIFICGVAASDDTISHLFDKILYLKLDDDTLKERLQSRQDNDYGKSPYELAEILKRKQVLDAKYSILDVTVIDAKRSLTDLVAEITLHAQ